MKCDCESGFGQSAHRRHHHSHALRRPRPGPTLLPRDFAPLRPFPASPPPPSLPSSPRPVSLSRQGAGTLDDPYGIYTVLWDMGDQTTPKVAGIDAARGSPSPVSPAIPTLPVKALNASFFVGHAIPPSTNPFQHMPDKVGSGEGDAACCTRAVT